MAADDREGGRFNSNFAFALAFPTTPKSKAFGPTKIFGIVEGNEVDFSVIGQRGWGGVGVGVRVQKFVFSGFFAPTTQQIPALQRARAKAPGQNHCPPVTNF